MPRVNPESFSFTQSSFRFSPGALSDSHTELRALEFSRNEAQKAAAADGDLSSAWICVVLLAGAGSVLSVVVMSWRFFRCLRAIRVRRLHDMDTEVAASLQLIADRLQLKRLPRVIVSDVLFGPAVLGIFRPTIVLPKCLLEDSESSSGRLPQLELILAHELIHIRRGDLWVGALQALVRCLWWFHPCVWLVNRKLSHEVERCCDESVVRELGCSPADYARSLLSVIEAKQQLKPVPVFPGMKPMEITSQRMERIMSMKKNTRSRSSLAATAALVLFAALAIPGSVSSQQVLSKPNDAEVVAATAVQLMPGHTATESSSTRREKSPPEGGVATATIVTKEDVNPESPDDSRVTPVAVIGDTLTAVLAISQQPTTVSGTEENDAADKENVLSVSRRQESDDAQIVETKASSYVMEVYSIGDLIDERVRTRSDKTMSTPESSINHVNAIIASIKKEVAPDSWEGSSGRGLIRSSGKTHTLLIRQTPERHEQVCNLLVKLREELRRTIAVYNVADIVVAGGFFPRDGVRRTAAESNSEIDFAPLVELIKASVAPNSWGHVGVIEENQNTLSLVIRQTESGHDDIVELLGQLRHEFAKQIRLACTVFEFEAGKPCDWLKNNVQFMDAASARPWALLPASRYNEFTPTALWVGGSIRSAPKVTVFNGNSASISADAAPVLAVRVRPELYADDTLIRLRHAASVHSETDLDSVEVLSVLRGGQTLLVDITNDLPATAVGSGVPAATAPGQPRKRVILAITPRVVRPSAEDEQVLKH